MVTRAAAEPPPTMKPPSDRQVARWLGMFAEPGHMLEIRVPRYTAPGESRPIAVSSQFTAEDVLEAAREALRLSRGAPGTYFTLNPVREGMEPGKAASDKDIVRRTRLLIDVDAKREIAGEASATDDEKAHALEVCNAVRDFLDGKGWPEPIEADSGNGWHLVYGYDLPNDDASRDLARSLLEALNRRFETDGASVDTKVFNASRITKVYGTRVRKGDDSAERPHRYSRVVKAPEELRPVSVEQLRAAVEELTPRPDLDEEIRRKQAQAEAEAKASTKRPRGKGFTATSWTAETRAIAYLERCEPAVSGERGHNKALWAACSVGPGFDLPPEVALRILLEHFNPRCQPPWSERELGHKIAEAYRLNPERGKLLNAERNGRHADAKAQAKTRPAGGGSPPGGNATAQSEPEDSRPAIEVTTQRHEVLTQTIASLAADPTLYSRGEALVSVVEEVAEDVHLTPSTTLSLVAGSPKILALSEANVGCLLTRNATFYQWRTIKGGEEIAFDVHPPDWLIKAVATRKHWPGVRQLLMVAECPYPRLDGSIVERPGFDESTGTLYRPSGIFPPVPHRPTRADARAAWERLKIPLRQFPFESDNDRAVWLAGLLTAIARPSIAGPVPGIAVIGNKAGTGKGLLVDLVGLLAQGRNVSISGYPYEKEEAQKLIVAIAIAGKTIVHFDNLEEGNGYGNSGLDSALTLAAVDHRILGSNRMTGEIPMRVSWFLSGNNIAPIKDAYRRWLPCNLVSDLESPEERRDIEIPDLRAYVLRRRGELVRDALTILRAHLLAGRPIGDWAPLGSFEVWDPIIRGAVWFATGLDCNATRRLAAEDSQDRRSKLALLDGWRELPGGKDEGGGLTTNRAVELMAQEPTLYPTLRDAFMNYGRDGKPATSRQIGNRIRGMRGNVIGGMKFVQGGMEHHTSRWKVVTTNKDPRDGSWGGTDGTEGSVSDHPNAWKDSHNDVNEYGEECKPTGDRPETAPPDPSVPPRDEEAEWTL